MRIDPNFSRWFCQGLPALLLLCAAFSAVADDAISRANEILLSATSPYEDIVQPALARDDAGVTKLVAAADARAADVKRVLPAGAVAEFDEALAAIHHAVIAKDHYATADGAVRMFKLLVDHVQPTGLKVPKEVSLLDYAGFKLQVLASAKDPNWEAMRTTAASAAASWAAIREKVGDKRIRDTVNSAIAGMERAAKIQNLPMLQFAAQIDLDLVDVLEGHFQRR